MSTCAPPKQTQKQKRNGQDVLARKNPEILPRTPKRMRNAQHQRPAERFAQRVMAMTPLFYERCEGWDGTRHGQRVETLTFMSAVYVKRGRRAHLSEDRERRDREERGEEPADAVALHPPPTVSQRAESQRKTREGGEGTGTNQNASLDARVKLDAVHRQARDLGRDVARRFHSQGDCAYMCSGVRVSPHFTTNGRACAVL